MGKENMAVRNGDVYNGDNQIVNFGDPVNTQRKSFIVSPNDCTDASIPQILNMGNFGNGLESEVGLPQINSFTINPEMFKLNYADYLDPSIDFNLVITGLHVTFLSNQRLFYDTNSGLVKAIRFTGYKNGIPYFNTMFKSILHVGTLCEPQMFAAAGIEKITGTSINYYDGFIKLDTNSKGLLLTGDDYIKFESLDITDPQNPTPTQLDIPVVTAAFHGYIIEC